MSTPSLMARLHDSPSILSQLTPADVLDIQRLAEYYSFLGPRISADDLAAIQLGPRSMMRLEQLGLCHCDSGHAGLFHIDPIITKCVRQLQDPRFRLKHHLGNELPVAQSQAPWLMGLVIAACIVALAIFLNR